MKSMKKFKFKIDNTPYAVDIIEVGEKRASVNVNGVLYEVEVDKELKTSKPVLPRTDFVPSTDMPRLSVKTNKIEKGKMIIRAPLPGKVVDVFVKEGDKVSTGQTVLCIEAMKMENNIRTDKEGIVKLVHVEANVAVMDGDALIEIEQA